MPINVENFEYHFGQRKHGVFGGVLLSAAFPVMGQHKKTYAPTNFLVASQARIAFWNEDPIFFFPTPRFPARAEPGGFPPNWQISESLVMFAHLRQSFSTGERREQA